MSFLYVALGGGLGAVARYGVSLLMAHHSVAPTWCSTLIVNILGSLLIGLLFGFFQRFSTHGAWSLLLITGFCGGFTTFSTFTLDIYQNISHGEYLTAVLYPLLSVGVGLAALALGMWLTSGR